jgi:two-component system cell cycle sensor histidine kinase/response regulator CckA
MIDQETDGRPRRTQLGHASQGLLDHLPDLVGRFDRDGRFLYVNPAVTRAFQQRRENFLGRTPIELRLADEAACFALLAGIEQAASEGVPALIEVELLTAAGPHTFEWRFIPELRGDLAGSVVGVAREMTEMRREQQSRRNAEERHRTLLDSAPDYVSRFDADGRFVYVSPSICREQGVAAEVLLGHSPLELGLCVDRQSDMDLQQSLARVMRSGQPEKLELCFRHPSLGARRFEVRHIPETDANGTVTGVLGLAADLTERLAAERQLYLLNHAIDSVGEGIYLMEDEFPRFQYVNQAAADSLGYDRETLTGGMGVFDIDPEWTAERWRAFLPEIRRQRRMTIETTHRTRDGRLVPVEVTGNYFTFEGQDYNMAIVRDISERKAAERALRESETMYRSLVNAMAEGVYSQAASGEITAVNPAAERIEGRSAAEMLGKTSCVGRAAIREDGTAFPADEQPSTVALRTGKPQSDVVMGIARPDGQRRWLSINAQPLFNTDDLEPYAVVTTFHDITARREAEAALRRSEEQLRQAQKMEAIGNLAGGIAHDFNNLLSVILGSSDLLARGLSAGDPRRAHLADIADCAMRAAELTRQLLAFSRKQLLQPKVLNLNDVLAGMTRMLCRVIGEDIELDLLADGALGLTLVDPGQIEQIILNLAVNSRDAMPRGGKLTFQTTNVNLDEKAAAEVGIGAGRHVMLIVSDDGVGMDEATRARVFEPFFTTKELGKGTGLGLATVLGIVQQSGGAIRVDSEPGRGACFKIYLPLVDASGPHRTAPTPQNGPAGGSETILLVEDDDRVRGSTRMVLQRFGYRVLEAANGADALAVCQAHTAEIDLLLTDVIMPQMSGQQLAKRLQSTRRGMRMLFMTGYLDSAIAHHGVLDGSVALISKPVMPEVLARRVREALDAPPPG